MCVFLCVRTHRREEVAQAGEELAGLPTCVPTCGGARAWPSTPAFPVICCRSMETTAEAPQHSKSQLTKNGSWKIEANLMETERCRRSVAVDPGPLVLLEALQKHHNFSPCFSALSLLLPCRSKFLVCISKANISMWMIPTFLSLVPTCGKRVRNGSSFRIQNNGGKGTNRPWWNIALVLATLSSLCASNSSPTPCANKLREPSTFLLSTR